MKKQLVLALALASSITLVACSSEDEGPDFDQAADNAGEMMDEAGNTIEETYEEATGQPVSTFGGHAYDGLMILVDAIKRAGSEEPQAIRDAIEETSGFMGTAGVVNMSADDHLGLDLTAFRMLEIKGGDWTLAD